MNSIAKLRQMLVDLLTLPRRVDHLQREVGRLTEHLHRMNAPTSLRACEFSVYSQWGEDGIIQYLIRQVPITRDFFVEFGVQDYKEANTRFLMMSNHWSGLVLDGSAENVAAIRADAINYRYALQSECAFIDRDNINGLLERNNVRGDIGLLSVDIDGNDYWVWEAIAVIQPRTVVCEYNSLFGPSRKVSTPSDPGFVRSRAHHSHLYYGASIAALEALGRQKGYELVGGNSAGNNVFFVRKDALGALPRVTAAQAYVKASFRESRDERGAHTFLDFEQSRQAIKALEVYDFDRRALTRIEELLTE